MNTNTDAKTRLLAKIPSIRARALGAKMRVALDKKMSVVGIIKDVEFGFWQENLRSLQLIFSVTLECGENKTLRKVTVSTVPTL